MNKASGSPNTAKHLKNSGRMRFAESASSLVCDGPFPVVSLYLSAIFLYLIQINHEIPHRIVVGDILHDFGEGIHIRRKFPVLHQLANQLAQDAAEILMSGVGEEASGIREHSNETGEISKAGKGEHLVSHADLVVVKPPGASLLDFGNGRGILETAEDRSDGLIVIGI